MGGADYSSWCLTHSHSLMMHDVRKQAEALWLSRLQLPSSGRSCYSQSLSNYPGRRDRLVESAQVVWEEQKPHLLLRVNKKKLFFLSFSSSLNPPELAWCGCWRLQFYFAASSRIMSRVGGFPEDRYGRSSCL